MLFTFSETLTIFDSAFLIIFSVGNWACAFLFFWAGSSKCFIVNVHRKRYRWKRMKNKHVFSKILVPTDGSDPSIAAQEVTAMIAKRFNSKVAVINVISHDFMSPQLQKFAPRTPEIAATSAREQAVSWVRISQPRMSPHIIELTSWHRQKGEEALADAVAFFKKEDVAAERKLVENSDPSDAIINEVETEGYSLVVMGQSGEKEKEPHLGGVARKVSMHVKAPVLLVGQKREISKMLVPVDGSEGAENALRCAVLLAKKTDSKMTLLHVQETGLFKIKPQVTKGIGYCILAGAAQKARGVKISKKLESGDPAKIITQTAEKGDYDLIVMGCKGHGTIARFLLGDVADHVINHTNRSVLLVR